VIGLLGRYLAEEHLVGIALDMDHAVIVGIGAELGRMIELLPGAADRHIAAPHNVPDGSSI
jgi:hypothetical protein